ncbi:MAG: helix-turn-helix transcriptional regulator [Erythrobacter sp.]|nr:helix-turn-helix transcriptional regulator [Erythrobacter sp.]MDZ4274213.1 helix-turn-helix transcriptional regulator [Erythrobacter sp.]
METRLTIGEQVRQWRTGADMSGAALALALGISRGKLSDLENGKFVPGVKVALRLEELSGGRIDAGALNEDVRASRHAQTIKAARALVHSVITTVPEGDGPASSSRAVGHEEAAGAGEEVAADTRVIVCDVCERRVDDGRPNACTFVDCPHSQRAGIGWASDSAAVGREKDAA